MHNYCMFWAAYRVFGKRAAKAGKRLSICPAATIGDNKTDRLHVTD